MLSLLLASVLTAGGFGAGGRIGIVFPASGLETGHSTAALFGIGLGYTAGPSRFTLDYGYSGLPAKRAGPYRVDIHELSLGYGHEFVVGRPVVGSASYWGFEASTAAGLGLFGRALGSARETGKAPAGHVGAGFFQRQGRSRLSLGLDNVVFIESQPAGSTRRVSLTYVVALKAGLNYVF